MNPELIIHSWRSKEGQENDKVRLLVLEEEGKAVAVLADIDTARSFSFNLQLVRKAQIEPDLREIEVSGHHQRKRHAFGITTKGVEGLLQLLHGLKTKEQNQKGHQLAIEWIEKVLLPEMRGLDERCRAMVGRPIGITVGRPVHSVLTIKTEGSLFECKLSPFATVSIAYKGKTESWTGVELMSKLGLIIN